MPPITRHPVPPGSLLARYEHEGGAYADCYVAETPHTVSHVQYVEAFYTSAVFGLERRLLAWFAGRPSTAADARQLATGAADSFAAWRVEARTADQLLLADFTGRTRSWLMTEPVAHGTRLYFGSAVVPKKDARSGKTSMGFVFTALLGFHQLYSRVLLSAARRRLESSR